MSRKRNTAPFESFGADMKEARKALGLSQKVFAEMVGIILIRFICLLYHILSLQKQYKI